MTEVLLETPKDGIALLHLNRPERLNALSLGLRAALAARIDAAVKDPQVKCIVITGSERAFAAGADLEELIDLAPDDPRFSALRVAWDAIARCNKPILAAVNGFALGGGFELAMMCDLIVAGESARFGLPEVKVGVMPGAGGVQRLISLVGRHRAMRWVLTGEIFDGREAYAAGILSDLVKDDDVLERTLSFAEAIAARSSSAVSSIRSSVLAGEQEILGTSLAIEHKAFRGLFGTPDQREGMGAFLARRNAGKGERRQ